MSQYSKMSRRDFIKMAGLVAASGTLAACGVPSTATEAPATEATAAITEAPVGATTAPAVAKGGKVRIAVGGWAEQNIKDLLSVTEFTKNTGIDVEVVLRTDTKETELARLASAVQAGDTPYDILDFEDELTTTLSQAGYMLPLNDLISQEVWDDLSPSMKAYTDVWSTHNGEVFRMIHNWEMPYWFYRKDWFDERGVDVPKTWDDVKAMGSTILVLLPVYWMTRSAFATSTDLIKLPLVYFPQPTLQNFATLMEQVPFGLYLRNSLLFAISTTLATLFVSYLAAYAFARIRFPGSGVLLWILLLSMALPDIGTIVPLYQILKTLHLSDSIAGISLVLTSTLTPFTVWVLVSFIKQVPYEIEEAAILDGASLPQILWHILLPVTVPGLVTMGLINFINAWNNLLYPLSFTTSPSAKTLSVAITEIYAGYSPWGKPWELIMAVGVTMTVPIVILVILSQRSIVRGLTGGAIK